MGTLGYEDFDFQSSLKAYLFFKHPTSHSRIEIKRRIIGTPLILADGGSTVGGGGGELFLFNVKRKLLQYLVKKSKGWDLIERLLNYSIAYDVSDEIFDLLNPMVNFTPSSVDVTSQFFKNESRGYLSLKALYLTRSGTNRNKVIKVNKILWAALDSIVSLKESKEVSDFIINVCKFLNARIGITEEQFNKLKNIILIKSEEVNLEESESIAVMVYIRRFAEQIYTILEQPSEAMSYDFLIGHLLDEMEFRSSK